MHAEGRQFDSVRLHHFDMHLNIERSLQETGGFEPVFRPAAAGKTARSLTIEQGKMRGFFERKTR